MEIHLKFTNEKIMALVLSALALALATFRS